MDDPLDGVEGSDSEERDRYLAAMQDLTAAMAASGTTFRERVEPVLAVGREYLGFPNGHIAVVSGEQSHEYVQKHFDNADIEVIDSSDLTAAMLQVSTGRADVAMSDHFVVQKFVNNHEGMEDLFADNPYNMKPITWAVSHEDQQLLTFLNNALNYLGSTGELQELMRDSEYDIVPFIRARREFHKVN